MSQAMPGIGKTVRRPPPGHIRDRTGGFTGFLDSVAPVSRCRASPRQALLAENPVKPSLWVFISEICYKANIDPFQQLLIFMAKNHAPGNT